MRDIRQAIEEKKFDEFVQKFFNTVGVDDSE